MHATTTKAWGGAVRVGGPGAHRWATKGTGQWAEMGPLPAGIDQRSPARHPDWLGPDDLSLKVQEIREAVESGPEAGETRVSDLHVWRVGKGAYSCALSLVTHDATLTPAKVRENLSVHEEIVHSTIEIQHCLAEMGA